MNDDPPSEAGGGDGGSGDAVTGGDGAPWSDDQWLSAVRWAATLVEPLIPQDRRDSWNQTFREAVASHPDWARLFFAGSVADITATLPENDPWRDTRMESGVPMVDNRRFGTLRDHTDLIPQISPDPTIDVALSAVLDDLDERAATLIVTSFQGRDSAISYLAGIGTDDLFFVGTEALRIAVFRRRCLMGPLDSFAVDTCWWWGEQGYRLDVGETFAEQLDDFSLERLEYEMVPEEHYVPDRDWVDERLREMNPTD